MAQTWLGSWQKRIELTVDQGDIGSLLTWFPVRIHLSASSGRNNTDVSEVFDELTADANRKKIAVTKADGITQLYVEIEKWDDANEVAELWVSRDGWEIAHDADTILYLYYDVAQPDNDTYVGDTNSTPAEAVWDASFKGVYHMPDGASNAATYDSTSNDNDGTKTGANEPIEAPGEIGEAQEFDGGNDAIGYGAPAEVEMGLSDWTLEVWFRPTLGGTGRIISKGAVGAPGMDGYALIWYEGADDYVRALFSVDGRGEFQCNTNAIIFPGTSYRIVALFDRSGNMSTYVNGAVQVATTDISGEAARDITRAASDLAIGRTSEGAGSEYLEAMVDEVRISSTLRNGDWIVANDESLIDDLLAFGIEETLTQARWDFFTWA